MAKKIGALSLLIILGLIGCKRDSVDVANQTLTPGANTKSPTINSFAVTDACLRKISINGANFNVEISKDSIFFGEKKGTIDSATPVRIVATFPPGDIAGKIKVYCNGYLGTSSSSFSIATPAINLVSPAVAGPGATVTITGQNFNPNVAADSVFFSSVRARILSATATKITAIVPQGASSGAVTVYNECRSYTSTNLFEFSNKGTVYVAGNSGFCYAIDISSGSILWKTSTHSGGFAAPTYSNGVVYIGSTNTDGSDNYLYALDAITGAQLWDFKAGPWDMPPLVNQGVLYGGGFDNKFYAIDVVTGQQMWSFTADNSFTGGGATYYNGNIYVRNDGGYFYNLDAGSGNMNWRLPIWPGGNPSILNGTIYTAGFDSVGANSYLYALDAATGSVKWKYFMQYLNGSSPTVANGVVYIGTGGHQIYAVNAETGDLIWHTEVGWWVNSAAIVADDILYVSIGDGTFDALDAITGNILWTLPLYPNGIVGGLCPVVANNMVFVGDYGGNFYALDSKTGGTIWKIPTSYAILSGACVVDSSGVIYHAGDSGDQQ